MFNARTPRILLFCACLSWAWAGLPSASAQAVEDVYQPQSGDARIDRQLADINRYAARYPQSFLDEIARYYGLSRAYAKSLMAQPAWQPGDIVMACAIAKAVAQPCRAVVREWSRDHTKGWADVAERLQSTPDPKLNRAIREQIEASYVRWARPGVD